MFVEALNASYLDLNWLTETDSMTDAGRANVKIWHGKKIIEHIYIWLFKVFCLPIILVQTNPEPFWHKEGKKPKNAEILLINRFFFNFKYLIYEKKKWVSF